MRYLGIGLFAEGKSDHRFLHPVIRRLATDLCLAQGKEVIEIGDVSALRSPAECDAKARSERILLAAREAAESIDVLIIHADGNSDPRRAATERVDPAADLIRQDLPTLGVVECVPVRETEAWALADPDAAIRAFGGSGSARDRGLAWQPHEVENFNDPKRRLEDMHRLCLPRRRPLRGAPSRFLDRIGEEADLAVLSRVPSFRRFADSLARELQRLRMLD